MATLTATVPLLALFVLLTTGAWVHSDAHARRERGTLPVVTVGTLRIDSPAAWFLGCLVLWVVFFPLYLTATGRNPFTRSS
ncbi:hypothetical protein [Herbidospora sp. RD11066]